MNLNIHQALKLTFSLVIYGLLSDCAISFGMAASSVGQPDPEPWRSGKNHYEPVIVSSNENIIRIKYLSVGPNAEHENVMQLLQDHCQGEYFESSRVELRGYDTVEAECAGDTKPLK